MSDGGTPNPRSSPVRGALAGFLAIWLLAYAALLLGGASDEALAAPASLAGVLFVCWVVWRLTPDPGPPPARSRETSVAQLAWLTLVVGITAWHVLVMHGVAAGRVPLWDDVVQPIGDLGVRWLSPDWVGGPRHALENPMNLFVLPVIGLLLLGARFRSLGFERGVRVVPITLLVSALPVVWIATHATSAREVAGTLLGYTLQSGPFEEFLFRGALQTRLAPRVGHAWAVVLQALAFGLCHLGMAAHDGGNLWLAAAHTLVSQAVTGIMFGVLFLRTRNLWAGSILHVVANTASQIG